MRSELILHPQRLVQHYHHVFRIRRCQPVPRPTCSHHITHLVSHTVTVKATFHYSSKLQTWLQTWFSTRFAARFSTTSCGFATCFRRAFDFFCRNLVENLLHQSRHVEIDAAGSLVRARARQMECRKNPFRASQRTCYVFYYSCLS